MGQPVQEEKGQELIQGLAKERVEKNLKGKEKELTQGIPMGRVNLEKVWEKKMGWEVEWDLRQGQAPGLELETWEGQGESSVLVQLLVLVLVKETQEMER